MRRLLVGLTSLSLIAVAASAYATSDPIATRKTQMDANGGAAGAAVAMIKGEVPFNAAVSKSVFQTMHAVAYAYGDYFPEGSGTANTKASPKIWEDAAGFAAALEKFQKDTDAAVAQDIQDLDTFKASFGTVAANCKSCHDTYRISD